MPIVNEAAAAADRVAIIVNAIFDEAADATANRVAVNATIVNVAAYTVAGRVAAISVESRPVSKYFEIFGFEQVQIATSAPK